MTVAVCLRCGEFKHGAFNSCPKCGYTPDDEESLTKHLLVTDHFHSREALEAIAARIKSGEPIQFDPKTLQAAWVNKELLDAETERFRRGCMTGCAFAMSLAIILATVIIAALTSRP